MALVEIFGSLCFGSTLVLKDSNDPFRNLKRVHGAVLTPSFLSALAPHDYDNLDTIVLAGETVPQQLSDTWAGRLKALINVYGPAEVSKCHFTPRTSENVYRF
jgi:gliotoxin/aspirochlorine biosynthesis peptide synthetase